MKDLRTEYFNMKKEAYDKKNIDDYIKFSKLYNNITSKIYHTTNKDKEEYKKKRYENLKRTLKNNIEYYDRLKEKNRKRNNENYISKKDIKK